MPYIADVHYMQDSSNRNSVPAIELENRGKNFITDENIVLVPEGRVRSSQPAVAVELEVVELELRDQLRVHRASAFHSISHIEDYQPVAPVREIRQAFFHVKIMQIPARGHGAKRAHDCRSSRAFRLPTGHFLGMIDILEIDDPERSRGVVRDIDIVRVDESAVHSASDGICIFGYGLQRWIRGIEKHDTVFSVRSALPSDYAYFFVRRSAEIVDQECIHLF